MNTFNYTLEYLEKSYYYKKDAIPGEFLDRCMPYCIANILKANHIIVGHYYTTKTYSPTPLHQLIVKDIHTYDYKGMWWERFALQFSNPTFSRVYLWIREVIILLKKLKKRLKSL